MIPRIKKYTKKAPKELIVCPQCLGRGQIAHHVTRKTEECNFCYGLRLVYKVTTYEPVSVDELDGPTNLYPTGL